MGLLAHLALFPSFVQSLDGRQKMYTVRPPNLAAHSNLVVHGIANRCLQHLRLRYLLLSLYADGVVRTGRLWRIGSAVRRHRTDVARC